MLFFSKCPAAACWPNASKKKEKKKKKKKCGRKNNKIKRKNFAAENGQQL